MTQPEPQVAATVREIRHHVRIDLTHAPPLTNTIGRTRKPYGLRLDYALRRDITRVDIVVEWEDAAEWWPPAAEMPDWLRQIVDKYRPADVDEPDADRPTGMGGWPVDGRRAAPHIVGSGHTALDAYRRTHPEGTAR